MMHFYIIYGFLFLIFIINILLFLQVRQACKDLLLGNYISTGVEYIDEESNEQLEPKKIKAKANNNNPFDLYEFGDDLFDVGVEIIDPYQEYKAEIRRLYGGDVD